MNQRGRNISTVTRSPLTIARHLWKDPRASRLLFITARWLICSWKIAGKLPLLAAGTQRAVTCRKEDHKPTSNSFLFRWTGEKMRVHALRLLQSLVLLSPYKIVGEPNTCHLYSEMRVIPHAQLHRTKLRWIGWDKSVQLVLSTGSSHSVVWFRKHKFYRYVSIALLSAAGLNWLRSSALLLQGRQAHKSRSPIPNPCCCSGVFSTAKGRQQLSPSLGAQSQLGLEQWESP